MERCDGETLDEERFQAWLNLVQTHAVVNARIEAELEAACGLSLAEHEVLVRVAGAPDRRLRMYDLAELVLLSKSGVTRIVDRLEKRGLVLRRMCETDRRVVYAALAPEGEQVLAAARPIMAAAIDRYFSRHLSDAEVSALRGSLRLLLEGNDAWAESRCSPPYAEAPSSDPLTDAAPLP
jgi:DNA-binding MarR family transcriptional regulator